MARVVAVIPDLLFGSNLAGALRAAGHEVTLAADAQAAAAAAAGAQVLVVDLTSEAAARIAAVAALREQGDLAGVPVLACFAHVEPDVREAAIGAGFDLVVPRSRLHREGAELVARLAAA